MNIGAVVPVYNREQYIGPYLDMLTSHGVECVVNLGTEPWSHGGNQESPMPDRTEKIVRTFFPNVRLNIGVFHHHQDSLNTGLDVLKHCDRIFVQDCDMFYTNEVWDKCMEFFFKTDVNVYAVNFETMFLEYYHNYNFGKTALPGGAPPILAIKPVVKMKSMTMATDSIGAIWDDPNYKIHHFRFAKANGSGKHLYARPSSNLQDYKPAPDEVIKLLTKWEEILKTL